MIRALPSTLRLGMLLADDHIKLNVVSAIRFFKHLRQMLLGVRCRRHGAIFRRMRESPEMHGVPLVPAEQGQELTICSNSFNDEVNSGFPRSLVFCVALTTS